MGNIMKTIKIHGNDYVEVKERIKYFRSAEDYKGWSLTADFVEVTDTSCTMKAKVKNHHGITIATGSAREEKNNSNMNRSSFVEICETSAFGRALGNLGIGIDGAFASADEVKNAKAQEVKLKINKPKPKKKSKLDDKKFSAMIVAIGEGKEDIVKSRLPNYILSAKQEGKLTELLTK